MTLLLNHTFTQTRRTLQTLFGLAVVVLLTVACTAGPTPPSSGQAPLVDADEPVVATPAAESETPTVAAEPPTPTPEPTAAAVVLIPTATPVQEEVIPTPAPEAPSDWVNTATVEGDFYILGNPNAPVRLVDYSDFL